MSDSKDLNDFVEKVTKDTPRVVINYCPDRADGRFDWGVTSSIPILAMIGAIVRVQYELSTHYESSYYPNIKDCPDVAMVLAYDPTTKEFDFYLHPDIPVDQLLGTLETIKITAVSFQMALAQGPRDQNTPNVLGIDGKPFRG